MCFLSRSSHPGHREGAGSCAVPGVYSELEEDRSAASTTGELSGSPFRFSGNECASNSSEGRQFAKSITSLPNREASDYSHGSETARTDCSSISGDSHGSAEGASNTALVQRILSQSKKGQGEKATCDSVMHMGPASLEGQQLSCPLLLRGSLLGNLPSSCSQGVVLYLSIRRSQACAGENGQRLCSVPYKPPGGNEVTALSPGGKRAADVGMASADLSECSP